MNVIEMVRAYRAMPRVAVCLHEELVRECDPYYAKLARDFVAVAKRRSWRWGGLRPGCIGVALCELPTDFNDYWMGIEAAGRRNVKKAKRLGYEVRPIAYNDHLPAIKAIRNSTEVRQGELPEEFLNEELQPAPDPVPKTETHGYPYWGVFLDDELVAFAGGLLAGDLFALEQIYGHADHLKNGVVPTLVVGIAEALVEAGRVKAYTYGGFYGVGVTMQRFKRKFLFLPHRVHWEI